MESQPFKRLPSYLYAPAARPEDSAAAIKKKLTNYTDTHLHKKDVIVTSNSVDKHTANMSDITRAELDARLETMEVRMDGRVASIEQMMGTKFAELNSALHQSNAGMIKWVVGTAIGLGAVAITVMTFVINNSAVKPPYTAPAPIIITVPMPAAQTPPLAK